MGKKTIIETIGWALVIIAVLGCFFRYGFLAILGIPALILFNKKTVSKSSKILGSIISILLIFWLLVVINLMV